MIALAVLATAAAQPCLTNGEQISGEMRWVETRRAGAKSDLRFPFIVLAQPRCVDNAQGHSEGRWVQLGLSRDEMKSLTPGAKLTIKAQYLVPAGTSIVGDILAMDAVIVSQSPP